ncbi:DUF438 domain-containing protein [Desulfotomaculum copahuensis]|uniref:Histidine kinase n=1 Tax=Desulfotomaculum copahuensis TaxID=1838280 RepID=A0A1B7LG90_9FIRM|nr:DUF438 domain-containing protein [Desulfotomaculum copahuensis]OAT84993.1 histidine kinase [Desulfotomaculum copahuensis]
MSEYLGNKEDRKQVLKEIIKSLHAGEAVDEAREKFKRLVGNVGADEIAALEQELIKEGITPDEIKNLCDVHAAVFKEALLENEKPELIPGHPLYIMKHENKEAGKILAQIDALLEEPEDATGEDSGFFSRLKERLAFFRDNLSKHYTKKENIFFPYLEKHGITGPPSVMWAVDDEIRDMLKELAAKADAPDVSGFNRADFKNTYAQVKNKISEMIFKEENILAPMFLEHLTAAEWAEIKEQDDQFGAVFSRPAEDFWRPEGKTAGTAAGRPEKGGQALPLDTGSLTPDEINNILTNLPVDITFVDKNDTVRYFSQGKERIFVRTKSIIGRKVQNCHPPDSVHVVERILNDFKSGRHNAAEFWLELNGAFVYIRYFALRDKNGEYLGTMEITQDVTKIRALTGEKRLLQY